MQANPLRAVLERGELQIGTWVNLVRNPAILTLLKAAGLDFARVDMEHTAASMESIANMALLSRALDEKRDLVLAAARKHGKTCAMLCSSQEQAQQWKAAGALLLAYSSDSEVLHGAMSQAIARIKG